MNRLTDELTKRYWVKVVPKEIKFVPNEAFLTTNFYEVDSDIPKPYGEYVTLTREQEQELFLKFNYAKYRATKVTDSKNIRKHLTRAAYFKEIIAYHNMPLCYNLRGKLKMVNLGREELESEVYYALILAIDKFDVGRGYKFSTYARMTIRHDVFQKVKAFDKHKRNLSFDMLDSVTEEQFDTRSLFDICRSDARSDVKVMFNNNRKIKSRERFIVNKLFGLNGKKQVGLTLLSKELGISKQRINQVKLDVFKKIRDRSEQVVEEDAALTRF